MMRGMPGMSVAKALNFLARKGYDFIHTLIFNASVNSQYVAVV